MIFCRNCWVEKPASEYYPSQVRQCGTVGECADCTKARVKDNRQRRRDYYKEYDAKRFQEDPRVRLRHRLYRRSERGKAAMRESRERWTRDNPEKRAAHLKLNNAVRDGAVDKPKCCDRCGCSGRIEGHHDDYSKPLDVQWLCRTCHVAVHREMESA